MKKSPSKLVASHNIVDMFKKQSRTICPACGLTVSGSTLNLHLENDCSSSSNVVTESSEAKDLNGNSAVKSVQKSVKNNLVFNQISPKTTKGNKKAKNNIITDVGLGRRASKRPNLKSDSDEESNAIVLNSTSTSALKKPKPSLPSFKRTYTKRASSASVDIQKMESSPDPILVQANHSSIGHRSNGLNIIHTKQDNDISEDDESILSSDMNKNTEGGTKNTTVYAPYYIANFKYIIDKVLNDEYNNHLFNEADLDYVQTFNSLSDDAQKLYVRLFQRKYKWLRPNNMHYADLAANLLKSLEELAQIKLLDSGANDVELETALKLLSLAEVKSLSKHFNFNASGKSKAEITQLLIKHGNQHKTVFFSKNSVASAILKKVKQILGPCYRLALEPRRLFSRILMLFSLPTMSEDDEEAAGGQQQQLLTLLQINKGELTFPSYKLSREFQIFEDRDSLMRYEDARQIENDILNAVDSKKFDVAKDFYLKAKHEYLNLCKNDLLKRDKMMPFFLRRYCASHVYVRCMNQGVEILQRLREYEDAVEQLEELLKQRVYCQDRRGQWWERLTLNLNQHLKLQDKAAEYLKEALQDPYVRVGWRHSLLLRAERFKKNKDSDEELKEYLLELSDLIKAPNVTINGRLLPHPIPGRRHIFISSRLNETSSENDVTVLSVEQLALEHYKDEGYSEGIHGEGPMFISLYTLLFWDIIYDGSIPDAFISPYQAHPLDLNSDDFFSRREDQITNHLAFIASCTTQELCDIVRSTWAVHHKEASLVSWDMFSDCEHVEGLVSCFGSTILAKICERVAKDFRFTRSGAPDLVVWNPKTKLVKMVEVKGPGDKLSSKQILWLDYLIKIGVDAEVCLIEAVGSKRLRKQ